MIIMIIIKGGETMDYEKLGLITDEEMSELSKVETDGVMSGMSTASAPASAAACMKRLMPGAATRLM